MKPATLYAGYVGHVRHIPFRHRFKYRIWMLALDLDQVDALAAHSKVFAHNRFALAALYDKDHGFRDGSPLRGYVESALAQAGLDQYGASITFLAMPRVLGYGFNPISFYFCHDAQGRLGAILHQVKNTFGGQIGYLMSAGPEAIIRQSAPKSMHVSPFFDMQGGYRFALCAPAKKFNVSIQYGGEVRRMTATMALSATPFTDSAIVKMLLQMPFISLKVVAAIHWQALKLFLRGAKFVPELKTAHASIVQGSAE